MSSLEPGLIMLFVFGFSFLLITIYSLYYFTAYHKLQPREKIQKKENYNFISYSNIFFNLIGIIYIIYFSINVIYFNFSEDHLSYILIILLIEYNIVLLTLIFSPIISILKKTFGKPIALISIFITLCVLIIYFSNFLNILILELYTFNYNLLILFFGSILYFFLEIIKSIFQSHRKNIVTIKTNLLLLISMFFTFFITIIFVFNINQTFFVLLSLWYVGKIIIEILNLRGSEI